MDNKNATENERKEKLSPFSLTMLALGSIIGAGMFLGSGLTISAAGPSVLIAYAIFGILMYFNLSFLAELSLLDPEKGSFQSYAAKAFGEGAGFVVGWLYWISGVLVMASEVTAASIFTTAWFPGIPQWIFVLAFTLALSVVNLFDARGFGKLESALATVKVIALIGFILTTLILVFTSWLSPAIGWQNLRHTALFPTGLSGFAGSLLFVFFAYSGTSVVGLAINESDNPNRTVPQVVMATSGLVTVLYVISIALLFFLQPWTAYNASASPFVTALAANRIFAAQNIMNFVILTAALSAMNASMYGVSRMLYALSDQGDAPCYFLQRNTNNVPARAVLFSNSFLVGVAIVSFFIPNKLYLLVTGASGLLSLVNVLTITLAHRKLKPELTPKAEGHVFHAFGYPVSNIVIALIFGGIFISAFYIPDQRPSFIIGLGLMILVSLVYYIIYHGKNIRLMPK